MPLPHARGPLSEAVLDRLVGRASVDPVAAEELPDEVLTDDDLQLALWTLYELHYRGFDEVPEDLEWDLELLRLRAQLEAPFEAALRRLAAPLLQGVTEGLTGGATGHADPVDRLNAVIESPDGPSMASYVQRQASLQQLHEFMIQRSIYHLKESDPQSWVIPRLDGAPKAALVELQYDEYGAGRADRLHATLFAKGLDAMGLSSEYGGYIDRVPGYTLAENNAMSLFGLHRRLRGAAMGHLAAFEATSSLPCRRYAQGIRRLGMPEVVAEYFDEHVEADAVHEQMAVRVICGELVAQEPALEGDVLFGAATCGQLEALSATRVLDAWAARQSSLLSPSREPRGAAA